MVRSLVGAVVAAAGSVAVYALFVRTVAGQRWENAVLAAFVRQLPVAPIALVAAAGLGFGTALGLHSLRLVDGGDTSASTERLCYLAGVALAIGAGAGAIIGLLLLLRQVDLG